MVFLKARLLAPCMMLLAACQASEPTPANPPVSGGIACTEEAKICPDGSSVSRVGPKCEFAPCPGGTGADASAAESTSRH